MRAEVRVSRAPALDPLGRPLLEVTVRWWRMAPGDKLGEVVTEETFRVGEAMLGAAGWLSSLEVEPVRQLPYNMVIDRQGKRHFHLRADAGATGILGS